MRIESYAASNRAIQLAFRDALEQLRAQRSVSSNAGPASNAGASALAHAMNTAKREARHPAPEPPPVDEAVPEPPAATPDSEPVSEPVSSAPTEAPDTTHAASNEIAGREATTGSNESAMDDLAALIEFTRELLGQNTGTTNGSGEAGAHSSRGRGFFIGSGGSDFAIDVSARDQRDGASPLGSLSARAGNNGHGWGHAMVWTWGAGGGNGTIDDESIFTLRRIIGQGLGHFRNLDEFISSFTNAMKLYIQQGRLTGLGQLPKLNLQHASLAYDPAADAESSLLKYLTSLTDFLHRASERPGRRVGQSKKNDAVNESASNGDAAPGRQKVISQLRDAVSAFQTTYLLDSADASTSTHSKKTADAKHEARSAADPQLTSAGKAYEAAAASAKPATPSAARASRGRH